MNRSKIISFAALFIAFLFGAGAAEGADSVRLVRTITVADVKGRIDHMDIDPAKNRLFVAALGNNSVELLDLADGKKIKSIRGLKEPQGVLTIREQNLLFVTNGVDGALNVYHEDSLALVKTIKFPGDADNIRYDRQTGRIYVGYGEGAIGIVDSKSLERKGDIPVGGHPESFQLAERGGRIFVNVPSAGKIAVIDRAKNSVITELQIKGPCNNFPMALDEEGKRLFVGCRQPSKIIVYDTQAGKQVSEFPIPGDADDIFFDPIRKRIYVSCGEGVLRVFERTKTGSYQSAGNIPTGPGARTSFFAPEQSRLYVAVPNSGRKEAEILVFSIQP